MTTSTIVEMAVTDLRHLKKQLRGQFAGHLKMCSLLAKVPTVRGTVGDNIILGDTAIDGALAQRYLNEMLANDITPRREVGFAEDVERLSGGEMQALAIVRTILRSPDIVILDEGTSAMDADLELYSVRFLRRHLPDAVIIVVSHRSTLEMTFDRQIVINRWGPQQ